MHMQLKMRQISRQISQIRPSTQLRPILFAFACLVVATARTICSKEPGRSQCCVDGPNPQLCTCQGTVELTATDAAQTFDDGIENKGYSNNLDCYWHITAPQGRQIRLTFVEIDLEENYDYLTVTDPADGAQLVDKTGKTAPNPVVSSSNTLSVRLTTDYSTNNVGDGRQGFTITYVAVGEAPAPESCICIPCGSTTKGPWSTGVCGPASNVCSSTAAGDGCYTNCAADCDCGAQLCYTPTVPPATPPTPPPALTPTPAPLVVEQAVTLVGVGKDEFLSPTSGLQAAVRTAFADKLRVAEARITIVASTVQGARLRRQLTSGSSVTFMVNIVANSQSEVSSMTAALAASGWGTELQQSIQQQLPGVGAGVTAVRTGDVGAGSCSSNEECNGHGTCRSGDCTCDAGWDTAQTSDAAACPVTNLGCCFERPEAGCNAEDHAVLAQIGAGIAVAFLGLPLHLYLYCRRRCRARAARAADANDTKERVRSPSAASLTGENPGINEETTAEQKPKFEPMEMEAAASDHGEKRVVDEPYEMGLKDKFLVKWFKLNLSTRQLGTITFLQTSYAMYLLLSSMLGERFDFALYTAPDGSEYGIACKCAKFVSVSDTGVFNPSPADKWWYDPEHNDPLPAGCGTLGLYSCGEGFSVANGDTVSFYITIATLALKGVLELHCFVAKTFFPGANLSNALYVAVYGRQLAKNTPLCKGIMSYMDGFKVFFINFYDGFGGLVTARALISYAVSGNSFVSPCTKGIKVGQIVLWLALGGYDGFVILYGFLVLQLCFRQQCCYPKRCCQGPPPWVWASLYSGSWKSSLFTCKWSDGTAKESPATSASTPAAGSPTKNPISEQMQRGTGSLTQPSLMQVTVPPGMQPGMQMQIKSLDGRLMSVVIPAGCGPGSTFQVQATNSLQTQAQVHKTFASGAKYEGEWEGGKMHGRGKLTLKSGSVYTGGFAHGKFHGQGLLRSADGSIYEGEYKDDKKHGKGKQTFKSGSVYTGGFAHGKFHGQGLLHSADGSTYEGEYKDDKKHGKGKQTLKSGSVYTGGFAHGKFHGQGLMRSADGSTYEGEYKYGKKHGQGKLTRKPKEGAGSMAVQEGEFVDDKFVGKAHQ